MNECLTILEKRNADLYSNLAEINIRVFAVDIGHAIRNNVWSSVSIYFKICFIFLMIFGFRKQAYRLIVSNSMMRREGLAGLYRLFLQSGTEPIRQVFDILAEPQNYPVHVHCAAGKDRTGLIVALIQFLCDCNRSDIVKHYAESEALLNTVVIEQHVIDFGLDRSFAYTPASVMEQTIDFIQVNYGSVSNYLREIGVDQEQQSKIKKILSPSKL